MFHAMVLVTCVVLRVVYGADFSSSTQYKIDNPHESITNSTTNKHLKNATKPLSSFVIKAIKSKLAKNTSEPVMEQNIQSVSSTQVNYSSNHILSDKDKERTHILSKIHATITRSKDAIWATITLTFMCVLLVLAVAQSRMWKDYQGSEAQGVPLPNFNERVPFKEVMNHRMKSLKDIFKKKKKKSPSELESLIINGE